MIPAYVDALCREIDFIGSSDSPRSLTVGDAGVRELKASE